MKPDPVRQRALAILVSVQGGADLDPLLEAALADFTLARDRAFLAGLVRGTLQWQGRYDHLIGLFAARKFPRDPGLLCLLRLSLHQLLALDGVPPFAALDQAVRLCKRCVDRRSSGFVNGLLRHVQRRLLVPENEAASAKVEVRLRELFVPLQKDRRAFLAAWHSHPRWLVDSWLDAYGEQATAALCAFNNQAVSLDLHDLHETMSPGLAADLGDRGCPVTPLDMPGGWRADGHPGREVIRDILAQHPELIVQDATVQEATAWLAAALAAGPRHLPVLDMCAAPGGKTACLGSVGNRRSLLVAMDPDARRTALLSATLARTRVPDTVIVRGDGVNPPLAEGSCGAVFLDGPCSGTGVLRRHPDARWRLRPDIVSNKARLLGTLAGRALDLLAPGGVLMYATCSLQPGENRDVVEGLLQRRDDLEPLPDDQGRWQRTWLPPDAPGDGFFAARMIKTSPGEGRRS